MGELRKITSNRKDILENLLVIADKYTDVKDNDFLKAGLFGYVTESMSAMIRDSSIHKTMISNESTLNTARIPRTVYNWAKMFSIDVGKATPGYAEVEIKINKVILDSQIKALSSEIKNNYGIVGSEDAFIIDKKNEIVADDYIFSLEHSIIITKSNGNYIARYILTEDETTDFQGIRKSPAGNSLRIQTTLGEVSIFARAYQYTKRTFTKQISSDSFLGKKIHTFEFEDQYAGAVLYYKNQRGKKERIDLKFSDLVESKYEKFAYFSLADTNKIEIKFSSRDSGFLPEINSTIFLTIFCTKGTAVPNKYTGEAFIDASKDENIRNIPIIVEFNPQRINEGSDAQSIQSIKQTIINEISTRNVIVTENDLNQFFNIRTMLAESINNGKLTFCKKTDNILQRTFNSYVLMREENSDTYSNTRTACIPTNTIDAVIKPEEEDDLDRGFLSKISDVLDQNGEYNFINNVTSGSSYYAVPFYLKIYLQPFKKAKYLFMMADDTTSLLQESENNDTGLIPESVSLKRGFFADINSDNTKDPYILRFNFISSSSFINNTNFKPKKITFFKDEKLNLSADYMITEENDDYKIQETEEEDQTTGNKIYNVTIEVILKLQEEEIFSFDSEEIKLKIRNSLVRESEKVGLVLEDGEGRKVEFVSYNELNFFSHLDSISSSNIIVQKDTSDPSNPNVISKIIVKEVPVVHSSFIENGTSAKVEYFIQQMKEYMRILKDNSNKLETSTFFNMKFYNTYGTSYLYNKALSTNIRLKLKIMLRSAYKTNNDIKDKIRRSIMVAFDSMNESNLFSINNAMFTVVTQFSDYIETWNFQGLNGTFEQTIRRNDIDDNVYPPEWLNLDSTKLAKDITFE